MLDPGCHRQQCVFCRSIMKLGPVRVLSESDVEFTNNKYTPRIVVCCNPKKRFAIMHAVQKSTQDCCVHRSWFALHAVETFKKTGDATFQIKYRLRQRLIAV